MQQLKQNVISQPVLSDSGIGGPDWYREKEKPMRTTLSGMYVTVDSILIQHFNAILLHHTVLLQRRSSDHSSLFFSVLSTIFYSRN